MKLLILHLVTLFVTFCAHAEQRVFRVQGHDDGLWLETRSETIMFLKEHTQFIAKDGTMFCLRKAVFWSFKTGYVNCGNVWFTPVYKLTGSAKLPKDMYFSMYELSEGKKYE